jgi:hypothetical protein
MSISVTLKMTNYIAHPFWPARNRVIEIEKRSGCNRQRSDDKRAAAIKAECAKQGLTYDQYLQFVEQAKDQWYRHNGQIIIPRHQIAGALVQTVAGSPKALRGSFDRDNFRAMVQIGDFLTDRKLCDGVFARFVKLEGSNQRNFQENEYIGIYLDKGEPFLASGKIDFADAKSEKTIKAILNAAVETIGIGAARIMGFGRGKIAEWK